MPFFCFKKKVFEYCSFHVALKNLFLMLHFPIEIIICECLGLE